ncbi:MAG TPA: DUF2520 domain-containing protein [Legionellales bacterium]|nr:DUF2520 domain-containing protein [Legionellales bacterium]HCA89905.1 DUF2520 domain-containing protein [Legionellales bacterium]|tara:strand:+ start:709 stop:1551 length:843 start_codon:yes stop_codon:yes gene_type:complete
MTTVINIIGAGKLGQTLGRLWVMHKAAQIGAVCNQTIESAQAAVDFIGQGHVACLETLPPADVTLITTPDKTIAFIADKLSQLPLKPHSIVMHCSGVLTSDVLNALKAIPCFVASVHPMKSFARPALSISTYAPTYCAIEGDAAAKSSLHELFSAIGSIVYEINQTNKAAYHTAGIWASNYLILLAEQGVASLKQAGVDTLMAQQVIVSLMSKTLANLQEASPKTALTGPIKRGDVATITQHLATLELKTQRLYRLLGQATLELTEHDATTKAQLLEVLE